MESDEDCPDLIDVSKKDGNNSDRVNGPSGKVPVTIITGHLGSGKTTLLNYVLNEQHNKKVMLCSLFAYIWRIFVVIWPTQYYRINDELQSRLVYF